MYPRNEPYERARPPVERADPNLISVAPPWRGWWPTATEPRRWSYEDSTRAFSATAVLGVPLVVVAAGFLAHGTVAEARWAHAVGLTLVGSVALTQYVVRRRVLAAMRQRHLDAGLCDREARRRARATLDAWLG